MKVTMLRKKSPGLGIFGLSPIAGTPGSLRLVLPECKPTRGALLPHLRIASDVLKARCVRLSAQADWSASPAPDRASIGHEALRSRILSESVERAKIQA